jgi:two-component system response regulator YesN
MIRILIVDDEEPAREAVKILGEWERWQISAIFEARDGAAGMKLLWEHRPEIVLVDLHMPGMDGMEFLQTASREFPEISTIVISGHDDFEFTRQAIKAKVVDYLLKPINKEELNGALQKAVADCRAKRTEENTLLKLDLPLPALREQMFRLAIAGKYHDENNEIYLKIRELDRNKLFGVALLQIMNFDTVSALRFNHDPNFLSENLLVAVNQQSGVGWSCCGFISPQSERRIVLAFIVDDPGRDLRCLVSDIVRSIIQDLRDTWGLIALAGIGRFYAELKMLSESHRGATLILENVNLINLHEQVFVRMPTKATDEHYSILNKKALVKNAVDHASLAYLQNIVQEHLRKIKTSGCFRLRDAYRCLYEFRMMMDDIALEYWMTANESLAPDEADLQSGNIPVDFTNFAEFEALLADLTTDCFHKVCPSSGVVHRF